MMSVKNYNKFSKEKEPQRERDNKFHRELEEKSVLVDESEDIKKKIKQQEEEIQRLKNSVSVYFIDKCSFVNMREEQSKNSIVVEVLKNGTIIEPVIYNDTVEWTKVTHNNKVGYVMTNYIGVIVSTPIE